MSWSTKEIPDLTGKTALVTGANGGLGLETARTLAAYGARVLMAVRDQEKARAAESGIRAETPGAELELIPLDLASLESVRAAAARVLEAHERIDLLINNAGVMGIPERRTADGFEMQLGVDHLGHWELTAKLLPALLRAPAARVVTVTSTARHMGRPLNPANPHLRGNYGPWKAYGNAKLANFHFGLGLQRRFEEAGVSAASLTAHPGLSNTNLQAYSVAESGGERWSRIFYAAARRTGMSPPQGALPQLRAATDPKARGGQLYGPRWITNGPPVRLPILRRMGLDAAIARLWEVSERETGTRLELD